MNDSSPRKDIEPPDDGGVGPRMTFAEHLEELRRHVLRSIVALVLLAVVCFLFQDELAAAVMFPFLEARSWLQAQGREIRGLTFIDPSEAIFFHLKIALYCALVIGLPYFLYEMWKFVGAGLYPHERRAVMRVLPLSFALLLLGVGFAYFVVLPIALRFLLGYGNPDYIEPEIRLDSYLSFFVMVCVLMGAIFQLPLLQVVLARFGIVPARVQAEQRKAFILGSLIAAAVITPTGDAITLSLVSLPMFALYELGIFFARRAETRRAGEAAA